ncbi:MAG: carbohydrate-binding domain-containing protein [Bacteroidales bacterium]|nr:carbohydrate-binding domain-containing protein [Bacteroidales bacterium]
MQPEANFSIFAEVTEDESGSTKTYLSGRTITWGDNEYLRLWYNDGADRFATSLSSSASASYGSAVASFNFSISPASASSYAFGGLYPASAAVTDEANETASAYKVVLPANQTSDGSNYDPAAFIMVMQPKTASSVPTSLMGSFRRAVALNKITLTGVKEQVQAVEITAPGKALSGGVTMNLTTGAKAGVYAGKENVKVSFASPLSAGTVNFYFTSWTTNIAQGGTLKIRVRGVNHSYTKTITAGSEGIRFIEGTLSSLTADFSSVAADPVTLADFAEQYVGVLSTWASTTGSVSVTGGETFNDVHYVPANYSLSLGGTTYNRTNILDIAIQGFVSLYAGGSLSDAIPAVHNYSWGDNPYNEGAGNGGAFQNETVDMDFLRNYTSRQQTYAGNNNRWANFCTYTDANGNVSTAGTPKVTGYTGVCSLERSFLILARFYKHLLDNGITGNIATACASISLDAGLYESTGGSNPQPETPTAGTIADFATQYVKILNTWETSMGTVQATGSIVYNNVNYLPAGTTITANGITYTKAEMLGVASQAFTQLYNGTATMSSATPTKDAYAYSTYPWYEEQAIGSETIPITTINTLVTVFRNYASSHSNTYPNYCGFPKEGYDNYSTTLNGQFALERFQLTLARFFKYLLDKKITSNVASACASAMFDCRLYGSAQDPGTITEYDGEKATDNDDNADKSNTDIYWEAEAPFKNVVYLSFTNGQVAYTTDSEDISVTTSAGNAVVTASKKCEIIASGASSAGSLKIVSTNKVKLTLNDLMLTSTTGPAINCQAEKRLYLHLADGTVNTLTDASSYVSDGTTQDRKGCVFAEKPIIVSGKGVLVVTGKYKHAICSDDYYYQRPGATVAITGAKEDGIKVNGDSDLDAYGNNYGVFIGGGLLYVNISSTAGKCLNATGATTSTNVTIPGNVTIAGGTLSLNTSGNATYNSTEKDTSSSSCIKGDNVYIKGGAISAKSSGSGGKGISADNLVEISGGSLGIHTTGARYKYNSSVTSSPKAIKSDVNLKISGGTLDVSATGSGDGAEGIEAKKVITISGGDTHISSTDDAMNGGTDITISGGRLYALATGNDAVDSNGTLHISGGTVIAISKPTTGPEEGFDSDQASRFYLTGGTVVGLGAAVQAPGSSNTKQRTLVYNGASCTANKLIAVVNASNKVIVCFTAPQTANKCGLLISTPDFASGASYTLYKEGTIKSYTSTWNGYYWGGTYTAGTKVGTFTTTNMITTVGQSSGPGR